MNSCDTLSQMLLKRTSMVLLLLAMGACERHPVLSGAEAQRVLRDKLAGAEAIQFGDALTAKTNKGVACASWSEKGNVGPFSGFHTALFMLARPDEFAPYEWKVAIIDGGFPCTQAALDAYASEMKKEALKEEELRRLNPVTGSRGHV